MTPEQKKAVAEVEAPIVKRTEWKDHIGIKENFEVIKILELIYGLLCNLELLLVPG